MIEILKNVCVKYCLANQKNILHLVIQLVKQMAGKSNEILGNKDVPKYAGDYFFRPWYERDLMRYFDYVDYQEMAEKPSEYFEKQKLTLILSITKRGGTLFRAHIKIIN